MNLYIMLKSVYVRIVQSFSIKEFIRFGIVGFIATGIHYCVYLGINRFYSIDINIAYSFGYGVSLLMNFLLTTYFTFRTSLSAKKTVGFGLSHLFNYGVQIGLLNIFNYLSVPESLIPIPVYCISIPLNFLLIQFVFKRSQQQ